MHLVTEGLFREDDEADYFGCEWSSVGDWV